MFSGKYRPVPSYLHIDAGWHQLSLRCDTGAAKLLHTWQDGLVETYANYLGFALQHQQCPAGRVFQYWVGSGRVLYKIPGSGSGSGRVWVSKYTIGYFQVSLLLSGISGFFGYFRVCRVFWGISGFTHIYLGYILTFNEGWKDCNKTKLVLDRSELIRVPRTVLGGTGLWV